jgi:hypothetical protein
MSGPIVRKYGFPNYDQIFGERPLEHGADEEEGPVEESDRESTTQSTKKPSSKKKGNRPKKA